MVEGAEKLEAEGLLDLTVVQQDSGATSEQIAQIVTDLAEDGNQLIVGHSFNYGEPIKASSPTIRTYCLRMREVSGTSPRTWRTTASRSTRRLPLRHPRR